MPKLTAKQKKKIIADYIDCGNYSEVARKYRIHHSTVKRIVAADKDFSEKAQQKKEEDTLDVLEYMSGKVAKYKKFTDYLMDERLDPGTSKEKLNELGEVQLITIFGILTDKLLKGAEMTMKYKTAEDSVQFNGRVLSIAELIRSPQPEHRLTQEEGEHDELGATDP